MMERCSCRCRFVGCLLTLLTSFTERVGSSAINPEPSEPRVTDIDKAAGSPRAARSALHYRA